VARTLLRAARIAGVITVRANSMMTTDMVMTVDLKIVVMIVDAEMIVIAVMVIAVMVEDTKVDMMGVATKVAGMIIVAMTETTVGVLVVSLLRMSTLLVKSVTFMDILPRSAGGATVMTVVTMVIVVDTRGQILLPKELIQTGTMTQGLLIISQAS
jgi:hypothetical protein